MVYQIYAHMDPTMVQQHHAAAAHHAAHFGHPRPTEGHAYHHEGHLPAPHALHHAHSAPLPGGAAAVRGSSVSETYKKVNMPRATGGPHDPHALPPPHPMVKYPYPHAYQAMLERAEKKQETTDPVLKCYEVTENAAAPGIPSHYVKNKGKALSIVRITQKDVVYVMGIQIFVPRENMEEEEYLDKLEAEMLRIFGAWGTIKSCTCVLREGDGPDKPKMYACYLTYSQDDEADLAIKTANGAYRHMGLNCLPGTTKYCSRWLCGMRCIKGKDCVFSHELMPEHEHLKDKDIDYLSTDQTNNQIITDRKVENTFRQEALRQELNKTVPDNHVVGLPAPYTNLYGGPPGAAAVAPPAGVVPHPHAAAYTHHHMYMEKMELARYHAEQAAYHREAGGYLMQHTTPAEQGYLMPRATGPADPALAEAYAAAYVRASSIGKSYTANEIGKGYAEQMYNINKSLRADDFLDHETDTKTKKMQKSQSHNPRGRTTHDPFVDHAPVFDKSVAAYTRPTDMRSSIGEMHRRSDVVGKFLRMSSSKEKQIETSKENMARWDLLAGKKDMTMMESADVTTNCGTPKTDDTSPLSTIYEGSKGSKKMDKFSGGGTSPRGAMMDEVMSSLMQDLDILEQNKHQQISQQHNALRKAVEHKFGLDRMVSNSTAEPPSSVDCQSSVKSSVQGSVGQGSNHVVLKRSKSAKYKNLVLPPPPAGMPPPMPKDFFDDDFSDDQSNYTGFYRNPSSSCDEENSACESALSCSRTTSCTSLNTNKEQNMYDRKMRYCAEHKRMGCGVCMMGGDV